MNSPPKPLVLFVFYTHTQQTLRVAEAMADVLRERGCGVSLAGIEFTDPRYARKFGSFPFRHAVFDLLAVVMVTSLLRHRLGVRVFRAVHWATYALWPTAMAHALGNGTDAGHTWFLLFAGCCAVTVCGALVWRLHANYSEYAGTRMADL